MNTELFCFQRFYQNDIEKFHIFVALFLIDFQLY